MKRNGKRSSKHSVSSMPVAAAAVLAAALAVTLLPGLSGEGGGGAANGAAVPAGGNLVIRAEEIGTQASYFDYDAGGITVQVLAVRASDDTVRLALNTCQVCNGSPFAYFKQKGDSFVCQNCKNRFSSTDVGKVSGGCNPVPVTAEVYTEQDGIITVPSSFLEDNAARFTNWKKF